MLLAQCGVLFFAERHCPGDASPQALVEHKHIKTPSVHF